MARKKRLDDYSDADLLEELTRRRAEREYRDGMTMTDIELLVEKLKSDTGQMRSHVCCLE